VIKNFDRGECAMLEKMKQLVREKDTCVLATTAKNIPHCSLMAYAPDPECGEIYMVTQKNTTKYKNLIDNPTVSLLIDTREDRSGPHRPHTKALTVDGVFRRIADPEKGASARDRLIERHPQMKAFLAQPDAEVFAIKITSFLLLDGIVDSYYEEL
jgi:nitroimidazol reductase NimA-like FMN-containing flavoprotein (pyridoxamine 5'-phosphate oxidase superfamily)